MAFGMPISEKMFGRGVTLFRLFGFEVRLDASWIVIAALITWSLAVSYFPRMFPGLPRGEYWWMGVAGALGLFLSIVAHELCHSLVANHYNLPMRGITLFIFGGVAEMGGEPQSAKVEFLMAAAGPASSVALGLLFYGIARVATGGPVEALGIFAYLSWINIALAGFNLIPAFPLDGGRILRAALWRWKRDLMRATAIASSIGTGFAYALMAFAAYELFAGYVVSAIWFFLIGTFLRNASRTSYEQTLLRTALAGESVRRFMHPDPVAVPQDISLREFVDDYLYRYDFRLYPVVRESDELVGCVTGSEVKQVPKSEWEQVRVAEVAKPCTGANTIEPDADALKALEKIRETEGKGLLVTERNRLLAIVAARDIVRYLSAKLRMEGRNTPLLHPPQQ